MVLLSLVKEDVSVGDSGFGGVKRKSRTREGLWWLRGLGKRLQEFRWCPERGQGYVVASEKESYGRGKILVTNGKRKTWG